eukprot:scaffold4905_cov158-Chaetoceros_neogracile.AAC.2
MQTWLSTASASLRASSPCTLGGAPARNCTASTAFVFVSSHARWFPVCFVVAGGRGAFDKSRPSTIHYPSIIGGGHIYIISDY